MVEVSKEKLKALEQAVAQIDRQFGKGRSSASATGRTR